jgi:arylsulfatase A-like enzyme
MLFLCPAFAGPESTAPSAATPDLVTTNQTSHLIVIVVDSLRADHLGCYGYDRDTSPILDTLANKGIVFHQARSNSSQSGQALSAVMTGRCPTNGGSIGIREAHPAEKAVTLAQHFRRANFATGYVTNQPAVRGHGFTKGFDDVLIGPSRVPWTADDVTHRALSVFDEMTEKRTCLVVHYADPGPPHLPQPSDYLRFAETPGIEPLNLLELTQNHAVTMEALGGANHPRVQDLVARYDAEISYTDACIGRLVQGFRDRNRLENSVVLITGCHGEEFLEHGYVLDGWTLYEEVVRVPLILWAPSRMPAQRIDAPVSHVDVLPTLMSLFDLPNSDAESDGQALFKWDAGSVAFVPPTHPTIMELIAPGRSVHRAVVSGDWKYIAVEEAHPPSERGLVEKNYAQSLPALYAGTEATPPMWGEIIREKLFYLADDPGETRNLAEQAPEQLIQLREALANYRNRCEQHGLKPHPVRIEEKVEELPEGAEEELEAIGYL